MNTKNNKRRRESETKIEKSFVEMLQERELKNISVSDICKQTGLNRSTFYANYADIYDLADKLRAKLENEFTELFSDYDRINEADGALRMFTHIRDNQLFYKTYFKLCYDDNHRVVIYDVKRAEKENMSKNIKYHVAFFRAGFETIMKMWLANGCKETPEEMADILKREYRGRRDIN